MASLGTNQLEILITTLAETAGIDQTVAALDMMQAKAKTSAAETEAAMSKIGIASLAVGAAVGGLSYVTVKAASDFQSAMLLIKTQAGASIEEVQKMTQAVLDLAPALGQTPQQLAQGLYYVESAGFRGAAALNVLKAAAEEAAIGHANLTDTTKSLTSILNSGVTGFKNYTEAVGIMDAIVGGGKMTLDDLNGAISTGIMPTLKAAGISFQQFGGALDVFTNSGVPAQNAAARLRMSIGLMVTQSGPYTKAVESMGMASNQLAKDMQSGGLLKAIEDLHSHLEGLSQTAQEQILGKMFGSRESATMMTLVNNVGQLDAAIKHVQATSNNFGTSWEQTQNTFNFQAEKMRASLDTVAVELGIAFLPALTKIASFLNTTVIPAMVAFSSWLDKHKLAASVLAGVLAGVLLLALVGIVAWFGTMVAGVVAAIGVVTGLTSGAIALAGVIGVTLVAAIVVLMNYWTQLGEVFKTIGTGIKMLVIDMANSVISQINSIIGVINMLITGANKIASAVPGIHLNIPTIQQLGYVGGGGQNNTYNITANNTINNSNPGASVLNGINYALSTVR